MITGKSAADHTWYQIHYDTSKWKIHKIHKDVHYVYSELKTLHFK